MASARRILIEGASIQVVRQRLRALSVEPQAGSDVPLPPHLSSRSSSALVFRVVLVSCPDLGLRNVSFALSIVQCCVPATSLVGGLLGDLRSGAAVCFSALAMSTTSALSKSTTGTSCLRVLVAGTSFPCGFWQPTTSEGVDPLYSIEPCVGMTCVQAIHWEEHLGRELYLHLPQAL